MDNFSSQPFRPVFSNVLLTNAFTGNVKEIEVGGFPKLSLDLNYTRGGGEVSSKLQFKIEHSTDRINWFSLVIDDTSVISTITPRIWEVTLPSKLNVLIDIAYIYVRVSVQETGVVTNAGRLTMDYTLSGL